jgi:hypothetical protein
LSEASEKQWVFFAPLLPIFLFFEMVGKKIMGKKNPIKIKN